MKLPWQRLPKPCKRHQKTLTPQEEIYLDQEVERMLKERAIYVNENKDLVLSSIYTVPKKNGKRRPVHNLRWVNGHLQDKHFKMPTMKDVKAMLAPGDYLASLDLTDCFWCLPVAEADQRFLSFRWRGVNYSFRCLPFGLKLSPYFITKLFKPVVARLQAEGHSVLLYLDDMLIVGATQDECKRSASRAVQLLTELGARINYEKSSLQPSQQLEYLGFCINTVDMTLTAPTRKVKNLTKSMKAALRRPAISARDAASLLGKLQSMADALLPSRVHTTGVHEFQLQCLRQARNSWNRNFKLSKEAREDLEWWSRHLHTLNGRPINPPTADFQAATDASDYGWGAWIKTPKTSHRWGGLFSKEKSREHINFKELLAIRHLLDSSPVDLNGKTLALGVDNTTALAYARRLGGRKGPLARMATSIFERLHRLKLTLVLHYVPTKENTVADEESRERYLHPGHYRLHPEAFQALDARWGPHTMDAFATEQDRQLPRFSSRTPQPGATWLDALAHRWPREENLWVNPPFSLIGRVLQHVERDKATITLLAPLWTAQPWYNKLLRLAVEPPQVLPQVPDLFQHPLRRCPTPAWLTVAWRISAAPLRRGARTPLQSMCCSRAGRRRLSSIMTATGDAGAFTASERARIHSLAMTLCLVHG